MKNLEITLLSEFPKKKKKFILCIFTCIKKKKVSELYLVK